MQKMERKVEDYIPLVHKVASYVHKKTKYIHNLEDLQQTGFIGLLDSFSKYSEKDTSTFETYAVCRIKGSILDSLRACDYLNQDDRKNVNKLKVVRANLVSQFGKVDNKKIANHLGLSVNEYFSLSNKENPILTSLTENHEALNMTNNIEPSECISKQQDIDRLVKLIKKLEKKEQIVLQLMYVDELKSKDIAKVLEVSAARVCQIHKQAIEKLRVVI